MTDFIYVRINLKGGQTIESRMSTDQTLIYQLGQKWLITYSPTGATKAHIRTKRIESIEIYP